MSRSPGQAVWEYLLAAIAAPASWLAAVLALMGKAMLPPPEMGAAMLALVGLWAVDFALGLLAAVKRRREITSRRMGEGLWKLAAYLSLPAMIAMIQVVAQSDDGWWKAAQYAVIAFCAGREALSILEKAGLLGAKLPPALIKALKGSLESLGQDELGEQNKAPQRETE